MPSSKIETPLLADGSKTAVNPQVAARSRLFGEIAAIMSVTDSHRSVPVSVMASLVFPAFRHGTCRVFYNIAGAPVAYLIWAHLAHEAEARVLDTCDPSLHLSEWNEGTSLWLMDFVADRRYFRAVAQECLRMFPQNQSATYFRVRGGAIQFREISRTGLLQAMEKF